MLDFLRRVVNKLVTEPAVTLAVVVAAINATTEQTWQAYAVAVAIALGRFVVSPAYGDTDVEWK